MLCLRGIADGALRCTVLFGPHPRDHSSLRLMPANVEQDGHVPRTGAELQPRLLGHVDEGVESGDVLGLMRKGYVGWQHDVQIRHDELLPVEDQDIHGGGDRFQAALRVRELKDERGLVV